MGFRVNNFCTKGLNKFSKNLFLFAQAFVVLHDWTRPSGEAYNNILSWTNMNT